ncbi:DUF732 domain-containing protein [Mycobacterium sp. SM1]|uniref:DUF732 domain-containing protein n=1 Tax=Mycobacterium sp. SM1 TaxID=2816243 RepID=UPI001BD02B23|nr:DUF732 domain-containing protein [Mycobacterium sp. SM1]MBS4730048.1 DUF732 domain-containing protein [Mycobacterium sp. SM1]
MRLPLVALGVAALIGLAVPVRADPAGDDARFLAALNDAGITYTNADKAVAAGKAVCMKMDDGTAAPDVVKQLTEANPGFMVQKAEKFGSSDASVGRLLM